MDLTGENKDKSSETTKTLNLFSQTEILCYLYIFNNYHYTFVRINRRINSCATTYLG